MVLVARIAAVALVFTLGSVGSGCGGDSATDEPNPVNDAGVVVSSVELGAGLTVFRALAPSGDEVELVMGPQGGWHIDFAVTVRGFDPGDLDLVYEGTDAVNTHGPTPYAVDDGRKFVETTDGWQRSGDRLFMNITQPSDVVGQTLNVTVELTAGSVQLTDSRQVLVVDNE